MAKFIIKNEGKVIAEVEGTSQAITGDGTLLICGEGAIQSAGVRGDDPLGYRYTIGNIVASYKDRVWTSCEKEIKEGVKANVK